jgi:drug/metabolite transporter (DMT)-like permease
MSVKNWVTFIVLTLIWGSSFLWIKIAVQEIGPLTLVAFRLSFGTAGLFIFYLIQRPAIPREGKIWGTLAVLAFFNGALPWVLIAWAEQYIDSAVATVLNSTVPLFTIFIAHYFLHDDRMTVARLTGLMTGFLGVLLIVQRDAGGGGFFEFTSSKTFLGLGAVLLASLFYAISGVHARRNLRAVPPLIQAFIPLLMASVVMWIVFPLVERPVHWPAVQKTWISIIWLGLLSSGVAYLLFYHLLHAIGPTRASMVTYSIPLIGVSLGVIFLKERLDWLLVLGTALIVSGVWVVNRR